MLTCTVPRFVSAILLALVTLCFFSLAGNTTRAAPLQGEATGTLPIARAPVQSATSGGDVVRTFHRALAGEPGVAVTITDTIRGRVLELRSAPVDDGSVALQGQPPPGEFHTSWLSHGIKIEVRVVQRQNETDSAFAARCKNKVLVFEASFPRDPQGSQQGPGPDVDGSGSATRGGNAAGTHADSLGAHDWSASWETRWGGNPDPVEVTVSADQYEDETDVDFAARCGPKALAFLVEFPQS